MVPNREVPMSERGERGPSLWPWAVFALLLAAGVALFFLYLPR